TIMVSMFTTEKPPSKFGIECGPSIGILIVVICLPVVRLKTSIKSFGRLPQNMYSPSPLSRYLQHSVDLGVYTKACNAIESTSFKRSLLTNLSLSLHADNHIKLIKDNHAKIVKLFFLYLSIF